MLCSSSPSSSSSHFSQQAGRGCHALLGACGPLAAQQIGRDLLALSLPAHSCIPHGRCCRFAPTGNPIISPSSGRIALYPKMTLMLPVSPALLEACSEVNVQATFGTRAPWHHHRLCGQEANELRRCDCVGVALKKHPLELPTSKGCPATILALRLSSRTRDSRQSFPSRLSSSKPATTIYAFSCSGMKAVPLQGSCFGRLRHSRVLVAPTVRLFILLQKRGAWPDGS